MGIETRIPKQNSPPRISVLSGQKQRQKQNTFVTTPAAKRQCIRTICDQKPKEVIKSIILTRSAKAKEAPAPRRNVSRQPALRKVLPTCCDYGRDRKWMFPGFYFCTSCDYWDEEQEIGTERSRRTSKTYRCKAKHESWVGPTHELKIEDPPKNNKKAEPVQKSKKSQTTNTKKKSDVQNNQLFEDKINLINEINHLTINLNEATSANDKVDINNRLLQEDLRKAINNYITVKVNSFNNEKQNVLDEKEKLVEQLKETLNYSQQIEKTNNELKQKISNSEEIINNLRRKQANLNQQINYFKKKFNNKNKKCDFTITKDTTLDEVVDSFFHNIQELSKIKNRKLKSMFEIVSKKFFSNDLFDGVLQEKLLHRSQEFYRKNIFSPQNLLRLMDQNGGQLSMTGINLLRNLESKGEKHCHRCIIPSSGSIKRAADIVDKVASTVVPFKEGTLENGSEVVEFEVEPVINSLLKSFNLEEASKERPIALNVAIDGSRITSNLHHTTFGVKMVDRAACDPVTGQLIYGSQSATTVQSRDYCFPLKIVLSPESGEVFKSFEDIMKRVKDLTNEEISKKYLNGAKPPEIHFNADLSAQWKLIGRGYGCKSRDGHPCHVCAIHDRDLHVSNAVHCNKWCRELHKDDPKWKCYHQEFLDPERLSELRKELDIVKTELHHVIEQFTDIQKDSKLNTNEDPRKPLSGLQKKHTTSIHFDIAAAGNSAKSMYEKIVRHDLTIREMDTTGTLSEMQYRLKQHLIQEHHYKKLNEAIAHASGTDDSIILLSELTPCILHMEMRTILKFVQVILDDSLEVVKAQAYNNKTATIGKVFENYFTELNKVFNESIFGTKVRPYNFNVPYDARTKMIDTITFDGGKCRILLYNMHHLLDFCVTDPVNREKWNIIIENYIEAFQIVRQKQDLSRDEIKMFQNHVDKFFQVYTQFIGRRGMTNYFHMLGSGHIADYLVRCGNLYQHSQQGWEAFNSFLKVYYFRRTTRGGGKGSEYNRIRQIARWLARRLLWSTGMSYDEMKQMITENKIENEMESYESKPLIHDEEEDYEELQYRMFLENKN
jgi:hypothetical protein